MNGLEKECANKAIDICSMMNNIHSSVKRMNEIVMHVMSKESCEEYFDKLIKSE